jgi:hypothetical protein
MSCRLNQFLHRTLIGLIALCVVGQSLGSAHGGFLCLGCINVAGGIAVVNTPCDTDSCCARHPAESTPDQRRDITDADGTCDCLDVKLTPSHGTHLRSTINSLDDFNFVALIAPPIVAANVDVASEEPHFPARAGPTTVRSLSPSAWRTILRL